MTDLEGLWATILEQPDDDAPRWIYADCLEEQGDPADTQRAEFIRRQLKGNYSASIPLIVLAQDLEPILPKQPHEYHTRVGTQQEAMVTYHWEGVNWGHYVYRRGFLTKVCCHLSDFWDWGSWLHYQQPIEEWLITDRGPDWWNGVSHWYPESEWESTLEARTYIRRRATLPDLLWHLLPGANPIQDDDGLRSKPYATAIYAEDAFDKALARYLQLTLPADLWPCPACEARQWQYRTMGRRPTPKADGPCRRCGGDRKLVGPRR